MGTGEGGLGALDADATTEGALSARVGAGAKGEADKLAGPRPRSGPGGSLRWHAATTWVRKRESKTNEPWDRTEPV